jgi:hypothetical protein
MWWICSTQLPLLNSTLAAKAALEIRINNAGPKMQAAMGTKFSMLFANTGTGIVGLGIAFQKSWQLTLLFFGCMVPMV